MTNTSIALNAWGGPFLVGSHTIPVSISRSTSGTTIATLGSFYIPANTISRGLQIFGLGEIYRQTTSGGYEADLILKVGPSGAESAVLTRTVNLYAGAVNYQWASETLNTGSVIGVKIIGSISAVGNFEATIYHKDIWAYIY